MILAGIITAKALQNDSQPVGWSALLGVLNIMWKKPVVRRP
jgi:hypothetical protein